MISSVEEVYLILIWILPGYFGLIMYRHYSVSVKKMESELEKIIWSLAYSLVSYNLIFLLTPFFFVNPITDFASLEESLTNPYTILIIWLFPMGIGTITGLMNREIKDEKTEFGDCWIGFQDKLKDKRPGVTVFTKDGKEIQGILNFAGKEETEKEIIISNPKLIIRDNSYEPINELELGKEMLFTNENISRISFWEHF